MSEEQEKTFKVTDRRQFTAEGDPKARDSQEPPAQSPPPAESPPTVDEAAPSESPPSTPEPMDFASFLLSLGTSGMVQLGEIPDPMTGQKAENLEGARQTIDLLTLLKQKTEGNLSSDESHLFEQLLYELRMKFISKEKVIRL